VAGEKLQPDPLQFASLTAGHGALTAVRTGKGRDIVVLHTLLADRHAFDAVLPALAAKHRVTLLNLPGYNGSQPAMLALMDAYVAAIEDGFDEFGIANDAVLIGNGLGGMIALAFALAHPERIGKLVLCGAAACFPPQGRDRIAAMAEKVKQGGLEAIANDAASRVYSPAYLAAHAEKIAEHRQLVLGIDQNAFLASCTIMRETDLMPLLPRLQKPVFIVCGEFDPSTPPALNKAIAEKVAGATYIELPGCGHCPPLEQPEVFIAAIKDFVGL
jgi:pimeloyl-ACP methyl ester carboxylesterase